MILRRVLFQPIGQSESDYKVNFVSSVLCPRNFDQYNIDGLDPRKEYGLWGMRINRYAKNSPEWNKLSPKDFVMFYFRGEVVAISQVAAKTRSASISKDVWNDNLWEFIYFVDPLKTKEVHLPWVYVVKMTKYKDSFVPMRGMLFAQTTQSFYEALSELLNINVDYFG
ncbi:MAG TPA: hypothetical protein PL103_05025 [Saccharofermentans sp.]|nr:hypothetical protein [Saccharofermentans sp.]